MRSPTAKLKLKVKGISKGLTSLVIFEAVELVCLWAELDGVPLSQESSASALVVLVTVCST